MGETGGSEYLLAAQVGRLLHVSPKTVSRWAKEGKLPYVRTLGGHRRFPGAPIKELAELQRSSDRASTGTTEAPFS